MGVVGLWLGTIILALKSGDLPLLSGAPSWLTSPFWGVAPFPLVTAALAIFLWRLFRPRADALAPRRPIQPPTPAGPPKEPFMDEDVASILKVLVGIPVGLALFALVMMTLVRLMMLVTGVGR